MAKKQTEAQKPKKETALAKHPETPLAMQGARIAGKGFENLSREDILLPRIKLLQQMSPEVTEGDEKAGTMFISLSNKNLGEKIIITPILHFRSRIKWNPRDEDGGIDCASPDAKTPKSAKYCTNCAECTHKDWNNEASKKKDQQPKCTLYENFVVLLGDSTEPVILAMEKTKARVAKMLYSTAFLKGGNLFDHQYGLGVVKEKVDDDTFFNFSIKDLDKKTDEKKRVVCDKLWAAMSKANVHAEMEHPEAEGKATAPAASEEEAPF